MTYLNRTLRIQISIVGRLGLEPLAVLFGFQLFWLRRLKGICVHVLWWRPAFFYYPERIVMLENNKKRLTGAELRELEELCRGERSLP